MKYSPTAEFQSEGTYRSFSAPPSLAPFVKGYWIFDLTHSPEINKSELELPSLDHEVIFKFGQDYEEYYPQSKSTRIHKSSTISGIRTFAKASRRTDTQNPLSLVGIKFHPLGMHYLLGKPLLEMHDQTIGLSVLQHRLLSDLEESLALMSNDQTVISHLNSVLQKHFQNQKIDPEALQFCTRIHQYSHFNLAQLKCDSGYSYKTLERRFRKYIGINPKQYFGIKRYLQFYEDWLLLDQYKYIDLVYKYNYYDQNHLIKEFQKYLGFSPNQFARNMDKMFTQNIHLAHL